MPAAKIEKTTGVLGYLSGGVEATTFVRLEYIEVQTENGMETLKGVIVPKELDRAMVSGRKVTLLHYTLDKRGILGAPEPNNTIHAIYDYETNRVFETAKRESRGGLKWTAALLCFNPFTLFFLAIMFGIFVLPGIWMSMGMYRYWQSVSSFPDDQDFEQSMESLKSVEMAK